MGRALFSDRLSLWVFVSYGIFLLGFFFFPQRPEHYKFYYIAVMLPGLFLMRSELPQLWADWLFRLLLIWLSYQLISGFWSDEFTLTGFVVLAGRCLQLLTFVVVTISLVRRFPNEFDLLVKFLVISTATIAVASMFSWYSDHPFPVSRLEPLGRIDNPILAGCAYGVFALLALYYAISEKVIQRRILYAVAFLVLASAVLLTHSRTAIIGLLVAVISMPLCFGRKFILPVIMLLVAVFIVVQLVFPEVFDRFYIGLHWRPLIWESVLARISDRPWIGYGYLSGTEVVLGGRSFRHAHSSYLGFLRDGGIIGFTLFLALVIGITARVVRYGSGKTVYILPLLVFALMVIAPDVDRLILRPKESWLFFWWPLALSLGLNQSVSVSEETRDS